MTGGGTKLPRSSPCSSSSASHSASSTSLLRPGTIFTCRTLTSFSSNGRSSSTYQTGFQYEPVASITTSVTPSMANQSAIASRSPVNDAKVRVCLRRPRPCGWGVRTHATTSRLPTSIAAQRSTRRSIGLLLVLLQRVEPVGPADQRFCATCTRQQFEVPGSPLAQSVRRVRAHQVRTSSTGPSTGFSSPEAAEGHGSLCGVEPARTGSTPHRVPAVRSAGGDVGDADLHHRLEGLHAERRVQRLRGLGGQLDLGAVELRMALRV